MLDSLRVTVLDAPTGSLLILSWIRASATTELPEQPADVPLDVGPVPSDTVRIGVRVLTLQGFTLRDVEYDIPTKSPVPQSMSLDVRVPPEPRTTVTIGATDVGVDVDALLTPDNLRFAAKLAAQDPIGAALSNLLRGIDPQTHVQTIFDPVIDRLLDDRVSGSPLILFLRAAAERAEVSSPGILADVESELSAPFSKSSGLALYETDHFLIWYYPSKYTEVEGETPIVMPVSGTIIGKTVLNGVPDYVEIVGFWMERAYDTYVSTPMSLDPPTSKTNVLVEGAQSRHVSPGQIIIREDDESRLGFDCAHELMREFRVDYVGGCTGETWSGGDGAALFAADEVVDAYNKYIAVLATDAINPITTPSVDLGASSYGQSIFHKYMAEQRSHGASTPTTGSDAYAALLTHFRTAASCDTATLRDGVRRVPWYQEFDELRRVDGSTCVASSETVVGNFRLATGLWDLPATDERCQFVESAEMSFDLERMPSVPWLDLAVGPFEAAAIIDYMLGRAARYYRFDVAGISNLEITIKVDDALSQVVLVEQSGAIRDVIRVDEPSWSHVVAGTRLGQDLAYVLVIIATRETGAFDPVVSVAVADPVENVMITRGNCPVTRHSETTPAGHGWAWLSPDVWVDNGTGTGTIDPIVRPGETNHLFVRLHNLGNADAPAVSARVRYQSACCLPVASDWKSLGSASDVAISAQSETTLHLTWTPADTGTNGCWILVEIDSSTIKNSANTAALACVGGIAIGGSAPAEASLMRRSVNGDPNVTTLFLHGATAAPTTTALANASTPVTGSTTDTIDLLVPVSGGPTVEPAATRTVSSETLPPGIAPDSIMTVGHFADGRLVGGFTWITTTEVPTMSKNKDCDCGGKDKSKKKPKGKNGGGGRSPEWRGDQLMTAAVTSESSSDSVSASSRCWELVGKYSSFALDVIPTFAARTNMHLSFLDHLMSEIDNGKTVDQVRDAIQAEADALRQADDPPTTSSRRDVCLFNFGTGQSEYWDTQTGTWTGQGCAP